MMPTTVETPSVTKWWPVSSPTPISTANARVPSAVPARRRQRERERGLTAGGSS
ncbi:hypothetical protein [Embleya sp. NPDC059237]|uniref:hypothetical protein n=1 Tax=Embleya sp. NPDC059237 TaxID=3346784 RepID=UPI0036A21AEE